MSEYIVEVSEWVIDANGNPPFEKGAEIVRCKDCREYRPELYGHISCELLGRYVEPDGFCAWGKRKESGYERD